MPSQDEIFEQQELLQVYRRTLAHYLKQQAILGTAYVPPVTVHGINEAREAIQRIKAVLKSWGGVVENHPDDSSPTIVISDPDEIREEVAHKQAVLQAYQKRLHVLELQQATHGIAAPPHIVIEVEDLTAQINQIKQDIQDLQQLIVPKDTSKPLPTLEEPLPLRQLRVFLCHSSKDKPEIRVLYKKLSDNGTEPWLDEEDILPGQDWELEIPKAVRRSDVVLVCLSQQAVSSSGYIHKEIKYALDIADQQPEGTIFIIPLRLQDCEVPERLKRWHWVNYFDDKDKGYKMLISALKARANELGLSLTSV